MKKGIQYFKCALAAITLIALTQCSDDEQTPNEYVNSWIKREMDTYYLWNESMPSPRKSSAPDVYFDALLSNEDRFSWIQENYQELLNSLEGINKEAGYEFRLYNNTGQAEVYAQIMYVKPNSPAKLAGLMRGDWITAINGQGMTVSNYRTILNSISESHTIAYERYNFTAEVWEAKTPVAVSTVEYAEDPNFMHTVLTLPSGKKVGYYVYNFFATGTNNSYNNTMKTIFGEFKDAGISDLVLDLRYNSGGAESATVVLASLIGQNVSASKIFTKRQYNTLITTEYSKPGSPNIFTVNFTTEDNNIGAQLTTGNVYFLTSGSTASASELLINGLKPYMSNIYLIGNKTVGKNVGSTSLYKENDPKNTWGMQPIIVKSFNSNMESDYSNGFTPNELDLDNSKIIYPLGDENERLLKRALDHIGGIATRVAKAEQSDLHELGSSADFKKGSYNLVIDDKTVKQVFREMENNIIQLP